MAAEKEDAGVIGRTRTHFARTPEKSHVSVHAMDLDANPVILPLGHVAVMSDQFACFSQRIYRRAEGAAAEDAWNDGIIGRGVTQIIDKGGELRAMVIEGLIGGEMLVVGEVVDERLQKELLSKSKSAIAQHEHG